MSGCVGIDPSALFFPGARDAVKTALLLLLLFIQKSVERVYASKMLL